MIYTYNRFIIRLIHCNVETSISFDIFHRSPRITEHISDLRELAFYRKLQWGASAKGNSLQIYDSFQLQQVSHKLLVTVQYGMVQNCGASFRFLEINGRANSNITVLTKKNIFTWHLPQIFESYIGNVT